MVVGGSYLLAHDLNAYGVLTELQITCRENEGVGSYFLSADGMIFRIRHAVNGDVKRVVVRLCNGVKLDSRSRKGEFCR